MLISPNHYSAWGLHTWHAGDLLDVVTANLLKRREQLSVVFRAAMPGGLCKTRRVRK